MLNLLTAIFIIVMLASCATNSDPSAESSINTNKCSNISTAKINAKPIKVSTPNPFDGLVNPGMNIHAKNLSIGLITKEIGLFELFDFSTNNLHVGKYSGDKFTLNLLRQGKTCKHDKQNSKFIIDKYDTTTGKINGCFISKFNCNNELIEINANISGTVY